LTIQAAVTRARRDRHARSLNPTLRLLNVRWASRAAAGAEPGPAGDATRLLVAEQPEHITELGLAQTGSAAVVGQTAEAMRPIWALAL
jgi:hypothetical protein